MLTLGAGELRPKAAAGMQNQHGLHFYHSDLRIACSTTEKSWFGVPGIKGKSLFIEGFWKVEKRTGVIKDRAKYSYGEVAGITSRLILADTFGKPVSYKNNSGESSAKRCPVSGQEKSFGVCGLQFQMT